MLPSARKNPIDLLSMIAVHDLALYDALEQGYIRPKQ